MLLFACVPTFPTHPIQAYSAQFFLQSSMSIVSINKYIFFADVMIVVHSSLFTVHCSLSTAKHCPVLFRIENDEVQPWLPALHLAFIERGQVLHTVLHHYQNAKASASTQTAHVHPCP